MRKRLLTVIAAVCAAAFCFAQETENPENGQLLLPLWGIKTNLLYDATTTFNLGAEFRLGDKSSLEIPVNWNPWTFGDNRKWKHILFQPEYRYWTRETFAGHFFGLHAHYAYYNVGNLPDPPFSRSMKDYRYEGWLAGAGFSYGYRWNFSRRWAMEATIGAGYAYLDYEKYECGKCGEKLGEGSKNYFGPTKAGISLVYSFGVKKAPVIVPEPDCDPVPVIIIPYEPLFTATFVTPEVEKVKARSESGQAYLDFVVGRSDILADFMNNAAELRKIHTQIESVKDNPDATITGITITGYASPEGTYSYNLALSEKRAFALKNHVKSIYGFSDNLFKVEGKGEDWATLDSLVSRFITVDKYAILEIIRGTEIYDERERKLAAFAGGAPYRQIRQELYPRLRRSDYRLDFTVAPFTVERGKEVFQTNPSLLSLNEMFMIANTYEPGSEAYNEIFETAARIFPDSDTANINAAANALNRKDAVTAGRYLERVSGKDTPAYWNNLGILAWLRGDKEKAAECFAKGGGESTRNAEEADKYFNSMIPGFDNSEIQ